MTSMRSSHGIHYARPGLSVRSPRRLRCASTRDYEQMVVVRAAKDDALAIALTSRLQPLAEAITSLPSPTSAPRSIR